MVQLSHIGLTVGISSLAAIYFSGLHRYIPPLVSPYIGSETGRRALETNQRCWKLLDQGQTNAAYLKCKKELEVLVHSLLLFEEVDLDKCTIHRVFKYIAECPVLIWLRPHMVAVTQPLLVAGIKEKLKPPGKVREHEGTALVNGEKKKIKVIVHGRPESNESEFEKEEEEE